MKLIKKNLLSWSRFIQIVSSRNAYSTGCEANKEKSVDGEAWGRRVVSGLQPTGALHVGNYFGALRRIVRAQEQGDDVMLFIADMHALTTRQDAAALQYDTLQIAALALAAGIDPERSTLFAQSAVPRHAELCWVLACMCSQARLQHLPQYREKAARVPRGGGAGDGSEVPLGLLLYPVLQAADVLVYRGTHVPVGADQLQHLQLAKQLVRTFHHRYGRAFPVPEPMLAEDGSDRLRSLRDPTKKMSKSDRDRRSAILLTDSDADIRDKIRKAVTDCNPAVTYEPTTRPGIANLITLHCLCEDKLPEEVVEESDGLTTAQYKEVVGDALCCAVGSVRDRALSLMSRPRGLQHVLRDGAARARARADLTHTHVWSLVGLGVGHHTPPQTLHETNPKAAASSSSTII